MTTLQKVIKYLAMAFALFLVVSIISGILGAVGVFGGFMTGSGTKEETTTYSVSSQITALDIQVGAANLTIAQGEVFSVESNLKDLTVKEKNGTLCIEQKESFGRVYADPVLTLWVPAGTVFDEANITTGAGNLVVDTLSAKDLDLDLGAGEVSIDSLTATGQADIDGGAGKITIADGILNNLDLDMGVGQLNLTARLAGDSALDLGVGETNITLLGSEDDYAVDMEKGVGSLYVNGKSVSEYSSAGNGQNELEINGGVGAIHLNFADETK